MFLNDELIAIFREVLRDNQVSKGTRLPVITFSCGCSLNKHGLSLNQPRLSVPTVIILKQHC